MRGHQKIKREIIFLIKGMPVIIGCLILGVFIAKQIIRYSPTMYQTMAKIKLDDQRYGFSGNNLYSDLDLFTAENKIETEAEILKSPLIVGKALDSIDFDVDIYRKGSLKNTMLYDDSPITIQYDFVDNNLYDQLIQLTIHTNEKYNLILKIKGQEIKRSGELGTPLDLEGGMLLIKKSENSFDQEKQLAGEYEFKIFSREKRIADIINHLDVVPIDKEIAVLRVVYKSEHPGKVADFVNALCQAYIDDYVITKTTAAHQTESFIDGKLLEVGAQLQKAELELEQFKKANKVVNTLQETETGLREISKLKVQLINLEMNEKAIIELQSYIENGDYFEETAINFGFGDLLMTELVKKLKLWQDERYDLLVKYTPDNEKVLAVDAKIKEVKVYVKEAIKQNLKEIEIKRADIQKVMDVEVHMFDDLPTREKNYNILDRQFRLMEEVYKFLSQKKIEASISSSANLSFHRIIQPATVPEVPVSPNKTLLTFVIGLLSLILGITFVYLRKMLRPKISGRDEVEKNSTIPIAGVIRHKNTGYDFDMLAKSLLLKETIRPGNAIAVSSTVLKEGKTYVARHMAEALIRLGYSVCILDSDPEQNEPLDGGISWEKFSNEAHTKIDNPTIVVCSYQDGFNAENLQSLKSTFDFVVIDSAGTAVNISGVESLKLADLGLFVLRVNKSFISYASQPDLLQEEFKFDHLQIVINDAHKASNYNGIYMGSHFQPGKAPKGFWAKIKHYYKIYFSR